MSWDQTMILLKAIQENGISSANGTIMMVPFSENKYGFNIKLTDIDGTTPLKDVTLTGVSNPTTELRTNAEGRVKFISDSPKHTISFSNFPSGYTYGDLFTQQAVQGYINDMTEIVITPNKSQFAGYNITFTYNGSAFAGKNITCTTNGKSYVTSGSGVINNVYAKNTTLAFSAAIPGKYTAADGLCYTQVNITGSCSGTIGSVVNKSVTLTASSGAGALKINSAIPSVGSTINIGSYTYRICHADGGSVYAITDTLPSECAFGNNTTYAGSNLASQCTSWYNNNVPASWKNAGFFNDVTVNGVTAKCFVPSYDQFNGGFSYFNSDERRVCKLNGSANWYWTSSAYSSGDVWGVGYDGDFYYSGPSNTRGFRPCLAIARSAFAS
nr:MAG TPA: hypothetical protein [Caudoviricetes sp.]